MKTQLFIRASTNIANSCVLTLGRHYKISPSMLAAVPGCIHCRTATFFGKPQESHFSKAFSDAEKIVGYPTSFLSLRCLLSDELSNVAMHMRKLVGTRHPLLKTAKGFIFDGKNSLQMRGLIVLLMSKAAGPGKLEPGEWDKATGIHPRQRSLAEITEMIHTANLVHKGVLNLPITDVTDSSTEDLEFGNKMAVLSGDFLLANASTGLAELNNTKVVEIMSGAIADLIHGEFAVSKDNDGNPILSPSLTMDDWFKETYLSSGSLLANSCRAAMLLAQHEEKIQELAHCFGKNIAVAFRINDELHPFLSGELDEDNPPLATSALSLLHLAEYESTYLDSVLTQDNSINVDKMYRILRYSPMLNEIKELCQHHGQLAIDSLKQFEQTEARDALENIARAAVTQTVTSVSTWPL